MMRAAVSLFHR